MERLLTFYCDCPEHKIEIEEFTIDKIKGSFLSICIYNHRSEKTGKIYKKPKLLADVVLNPDKTRLFKSAFKK